MIFLKNEYKKSGYLYLFELHIINLQVKKVKKILLKQILKNNFNNTFIKLHLMTIV